MITCAGCSLHAAGPVIDNVQLSLGDAHSMPDNAPITPEDRPATLRDLTTAIAAAEERTVEVIAAAKRQTVDELTEVMRDMQTEILTGLQAFAKGNFARFNSIESHQSDINIRLAAIEAVSYTHLTLPTNREV